MVSARGANFPTIARCSAYLAFQMHFPDLEMPLLKCIFVLSFSCSFSFSVFVSLSNSKYLRAFHDTLDGRSITLDVKLEESDTLRLIKDPCPPDLRRKDPYNISTSSLECGGFGHH